MKRKGKRPLIVAEHAVLNTAYHSSDNFPKWSAAYIRNYLNNTGGYTTSGWLTGKTVLQGAAQLKTLYTRIQAYGTGANNYTSNASLYETTEDKIFYLGLEEIFYNGTDNATIANSATTDTATIRTNGSKVLFADNNARKVVNTDSSQNWEYYLRTPGVDGNNGTVNGVQTNGTIYGGTNWGAPRGVRPAAWVVQQ